MNQEQRYKGVEIEEGMSIGGDMAMLYISARTGFQI